tara:strand:- start:1209 stop:2504 length:1296 start_codon:yes stop_codon:yes gene_type:complete
MAQAVGQQKDKQEKASICTFYYAIAKGASLEPDADKDLKASLRKIYPLMDPTWYGAFLKQARALIGYLGHREGSKDSSWAYAWYDGPTEEIPRSDQTDLINHVWDSFTSTQQRLFGSQKDSWNTVDVYMVKKNQITKMKQMIKTMEDEFQGGDLSPEIYIGVINTFMSNALASKLLIPISLKKVTPAAASASLKETNLDVGTDKLTVKEGFIESPLKTKFEIFTKSKKLNFNTNSMTFNVNFTAGKYTTPYYWETRMSGNNQKTELKDRVVGKRGGLTNAQAQAGSIPVPMMKQLVNEFGRYGLDHNISANLNNKTFWKGLLKELIRDKTIPKDFGEMSIFGTSVTPDEFIDRAFELDAMKATDVQSLYGVSKDKFSAKLRQKLRQLLIMDAFVQAKKHGKLADFIGQSYYRAAKMNLSQADLSGPFVKIS